MLSSRRRKKLQRTQTNIISLDQLLEGGIPAGSVCTVLGDCGTGKSTFGVQFLIAGVEPKLNRRGEPKPIEWGVYICAEQNKKAIFGDFEHLDLQKYVDEEKIRILDLTSSRLDFKSSISTPTSSGLLDELNQILISLFQEVEEKNIQRIVIDHLQSILTLTAKRSNNSGDIHRDYLRNTIFRITELCRQTGTTALLISEEKSLISEEYMVDGVIYLRKRTINGRKIREISLRKVRRTRIGQETFLMTMEGGKVDCFLPYDPFRKPTLLGPPEEQPQKDVFVTDHESSLRYISSGIPDFDENLLHERGFRYGSWNVFEFAYGLDPWSILLPLTTNHLNLGRGMIIFLPEGYSASRYLSDQRKHILEEWQESLSTNTIFFQRAVGQTETSRQLNNDQEEAFQEIIQARKTLLEKSDPPILTILNLDTLEAQYGPVKLSSFLSQIIGLLSPEEKDVFIGIKRAKQTPEEGTLTPTSHWYIGLIHSTVTIYGIVPQTQLYTIKFDYYSKSPRINLVPIV